MLQHINKILEQKTDCLIMHVEVCVSILNMNKTVVNTLTPTKSIEKKSRELMFFFNWITSVRVFEYNTPRCHTSKECIDIKEHE